MQELARAIAAHVKKKYSRRRSGRPSHPRCRSPRRPRLWRPRHPPGAERPRAPPLLRSSAAPLSFPSLENDPQSNIVLLGGSDVNIFDEPLLGYAPDNHVRTPASGALASPNTSPCYLGKPLDTYAMVPEPPVFGKIAHESSSHRTAPQVRSAPGRRGAVAEKARHLAATPPATWCCPPVPGSNGQGRNSTEARTPTEAIAPEVRWR